MIEIVKSSNGRHFIRDLRSRTYRPVTEKTCLSTADAASFLGCSVQYVHKLMKAGRLAFTKRRGVYSIRLFDLINFKTQHFKRRMAKMAYRTRQELIDENQELLDRIEELEAEIEDGDDDDPDDDPDGGPVDPDDDDDGFLNPEED